MKSPLPMIDGVGASSHWLPDGDWPSVLAYLSRAFPEVGESVWQARMAAGRVVDEQGNELSPTVSYRPHSRVFYYRELDAEPEVPYASPILYQDDHLLVVDKPHFLPVVPSGRYLRQTVLVRLRQMTGLTDLVPLHRLDRDTAGLVLFSVNPQTRADYAGLFLKRRVTKVYEALAPVQESLQAPRVYRSRLVAGEPFYRMQEVAGAANTESHIQMLGERDGLGVYQLCPVTGRKHQLRVHMASLGAPLLNDPLYPTLRLRDDDDFSRPLQLLARSLTFIDPVSGGERHFESARQLDPRA